MENDIILFKRKINKVNNKNKQYIIEKNQEIGKFDKKNSEIFRKKIKYVRIGKNNNLFRIEKNINSVDFKDSSFNEIKTKNITPIQSQQILKTINKNSVAKSVNINNKSHIDPNQFKNISPNKIKINKKILIYQNLDMHTEVIGVLIYNFLEYDINIFYQHINSPSNCIPYYEQIFNKKIQYVKMVDENIYDIIIVLTSREIDLIKPKNKKKYIMINHENGTVNNDYFNISLTPIVRSNIYVLPIYSLLNNMERSNKICIVGSLYSHQRDIPNILSLIKNFPTYTVCLFTRFIEEKNKNIFSEHKNFIIYEKMNTTSMINEIRKAKFIYTADTKNYTEKGVRGGILTGMVPLGLNNNIPIIMTKRLNTIYNLKGVLEYNNDIIELKNELNNITSSNYQILLEKSKNDAKRICLENKLKFGIIKDKYI